MMLKGDKVKQMLSSCDTDTQEGDEDYCFL